jgi:hypothetical protein
MEKIACRVCGKKVAARPDGTPLRHHAPDDYVGPIAGDGNNCVEGIPSLRHLAPPVESPLYYIHVERRAGS